MLNKHRILFLIGLLLVFLPRFVSAVDATKVLGPETCGTCHRLEYDVWKKTRHYQLLDTLYKNPMAQGIAQKMGERLIKVDSLCLTCHFTPKQAGTKLTATAGVSCESCHGAAANWINIHNDFGPGSTIKTESPEHRKQRIASVIAAGMNVPEQLYSLAGNCYGCHTVQNEKLVNVGGHPSGSSFDLVERAAKIRHNFIHGNRKSNPEASPERKRLMYLIGWTLELEYGLRGAAKATEDGRFVKAMQTRAKSALSELQGMKKVVSIPELDQILNAAQGIAVKPNNQAELIHAADKVAAAGRSIAETQDGSKLAALDDLVTTTEEEAAPATGGGGGGSTAAAGGGGGSKPTIHPPSSHKTIGPSNCGCHGTQNDWWSKNKHFKSAEPFLNDDPKRVKIARLYGISADDMKTGKGLCMECHGTVVSGKEKRDVDDGVSCENCHGPAADFVKVHNEGGKFHPEAYQKGMRELAKLDVRAQTCTGCHYVTEPRLISAGHPSNEGFDYVKGMEEIKHWKAANDGAAIKVAFDAEIAKRGPVPKVTPITVAPEIPEESEGSGGSGGGSGGAGGSSSGGGTTPAPKGITVGEKKSHILPAPGHKLLGPGNCASCHTKQNDWWSGDKHNQSASPFWDEKPKNVKIAGNYGISTKDMQNGQNICMDCHGTVVTGKESKPTSDGVGCENCHGPGGDFIKTHNAGGKFQAVAFTQGMRDLTNLDTRAKLCTDCHYITDARLIASGHPTNANFDFIKGMDRIKHWKAANDPAKLKPAFEAALAKRGAIPKVAPPAGASTAAEEEPEEEEPAQATDPRPSGMYQDSGSVDLPPFPEIKESASLDEILLIIKKRIELIHKGTESKP